MLFLSEMTAVVYETVVSRCVQLLDLNQFLRYASRNLHKKKLIFNPEVCFTVIYTSKIGTASELTIVMINFGILITNF